jgi:glycosyltransferase involved in cell wall biosynthesis
VVVAAHDEAERLPATLAAVRDAFPGARVLVADDASGDATPDLARAAGAELIRTERRLGKGGANTLAVKHLLAAGTPSVVVLCDGDLGASAAHLPALVAAVEHGEGDLAVAAFARRVGGGVGLARAVSQRVIAHRAGVVPVAPLSGQRALRPEVLTAVLPFARGFGMETAMTADAVRAGFRLAEVELPLTHRATGRTIAGFLHRGRQLLDIVRVLGRRRRR